MLHESSLLTQTAIDFINIFTLLHSNNEKQKLLILSAFFGKTFSLPCYTFTQSNIRGLHKKLL